MLRNAPTDSVLNIYKWFSSDALIMREVLLFHFLGVVVAQSKCPDHSELQCWDGIVPSCLEYNATELVSPDDYFDDDCLNVCVCNDGKQMQVWGNPELNQFVCIDDCNKPVSLLMKFTLRFIVLSEFRLSIADLEMNFLVSITGKTVHIVSSPVFDVTERKGRQLQIFRLVCFDDLSEEEIEDVKMQVNEQFGGQNETTSVHLEETDSFVEAVKSIQSGFFEVLGPSYCAVNDDGTENNLYEAKSH